MAWVSGLIGTGKWYVVLMEMRAAWGRTLLWFFHVLYFEGMNVAIVSSHCFLLLYLWGMGIRENGLQSASALLLTMLAYIQEEKRQHINQRVPDVFCFFLCSVLLFVIVHIWTTKRDKVWTFLSFRSLFHFFSCLPGLCYTKRLFH